MVTHSGLSSRFLGFRSDGIALVSCSGLSSRFPGFRVEVRGAPQLPRLGHCWAPVSASDAESVPNIANFLIFANVINTYKYSGVNRATIDKLCWE